MAVQLRLRRTLVSGLLALGVTAPVVARGAGLEVPENTAYAIARGGTTAAMSGTAYSLQFNPAGLADVEGWDIRLDARVVSHDVTFQRAPRKYNGDTGPLSFDKVANSAGAFVGPGVVAAYHPSGGYISHFAFGLGVFGPPGVGKYQYPSPADAPDDGYGSSSGQRYGLISNSNTILFPSLGVAYKPVKWFSAGLTVQSAFASISFSQAIAGASVSGLETPQTDALANLKVTDPWSPSFIAGILAKPLDNLSIGVTFRPQVVIDAKGTLDITAPASQTSFKQIGNEASLKLNLAPQARVGIGYSVGDFSVAADGVWEGWSVYKDLVLDASQIQVQKTANSKPTSVGTTVIPKNWKDTWSGRLGLSYFVLRPRRDHVGVQAHVGALYETNAIPSSSQNIDEVTGDRLGFSAGATVSYNAFSVTLGAMVYKPVTLNITDSQAARSVADSTDPDKPPVTIGNGTYNSNIWMLGVGFGWTPGAAK